MKQHFELERMGEIKQVSIEPVVYQDKHMYEVGVDGEYAVIYQEGSEWKQEVDEKLDQDLFGHIVKILNSDLLKLQTK